MKVGGGVETWMVVIPVMVGVGLVVYFFGGPTRVLFLLEQMAEDAWTVVRNAVM